MRNKHGSMAIRLWIGWVLLVPAVGLAEEDSVEARLKALEQQILQQQTEFREQREALERTIEQQQKNLDAQQRQMSAQYELIMQLQAQQAGTARGESGDTPPALADSAADSVAPPAAASDGPSVGQQAAEAELAKRTAAGADQPPVDVQATLYDPSNTVFDPDFPGAWHLPGTTAAMKIGGYVNLSLVTSFDPLLISDRFIVGSIPLEGQVVTGSRTGTDVTASQTRLNFEVREETNHGVLRAFIEGDFEGDGESFRLRHAFGQYRNLLAGKTWSTFANVNALPEEVDFEGVNGVVLRRQPQFRFFPEFGRDLSAVLSIEEPGTDIVNGTGSKGRWDLVASFDRLPLVGFGSWNYRVSAIVRDLQGTVGAPDNDPESAVQQQSTTGWGVTTSGRREIHRWGQDNFVLWQFTYGEGIGRYVNDLSTIGGGDAVFDPEGKLRALPVFAGFLSYRHHWGSKPWFMKDYPGILRSNFTLSWIDVDNYEYQDDGDYNKTWRASANLIYFPTQNLRIGAELLWGRRENKDGNTGTAKQLQVSARYNF